MNTDTKIKIIKNGACIVSAIIIIVLFSVFSAGKSFLENLNYFMPFIMIELVLGVFSFYWSITKGNRQSLVNILIIIGTMVIALGYIVSASICAVAFQGTADAPIGIKTAAMIFFIASWVCIAFCLFCPIYIDFFADKVEKNKIAK